MNGYEFAQQYYKRLADGERVKRVNGEVLRDGERITRSLDITLRFGSSGVNYTWAPKTITVTIPAPMTERPKVGHKYYFQDNWDAWAGDTSDEMRFAEAPIWATRKDRDEAMRILSGGKVNE